MSSSSANQQWGGRFAEGPSAIMAAINASIGFDRKMWRQDIQGSLAHAAMLSHVGIISAEDEAAIRDGLGKIAARIEAGDFPFDEALEDIHMNIEARLTETIGEAGKRLHTGRSRNDQVALDVRLWVRDAIDGLSGQIKDLMRALVARAEEQAGSVMPGFTHLQPAQPVTFGHHMLAYVEMLSRDLSRLADCRARLNESPLGAAALAGTGFAIDRHMTAKALGFDRPMRNSLDAVASRDFAAEFLFCCAMCSVHLSRLAEEIVIWTNPYFGFVKLSDAFTTGSSIMPQKRNPDAAELVRGKTGRVMGALMGMLTVMKGLALTYFKDMQEDKEGIFDAAENLTLTLAATAGMVRDMKPQKERLAAAAGAGFSTATDLADWLVRSLKMPFRDAHHVTGTLVAKAEARGVDLAGLTLAEMQAVEPRITQGVFDVLTVEASVRSRTSYGGTAPANVAAMAAEWKAKLA
ncbi:MAG: argininosuccinate lyase [Roseomonas sp.]|nr:argininosuccinate lyase [Roseomonas sp.]MCA3328376.1 argininosuccinate lyase [Roseomonas sp.]MCA3330836.1 argininosuccinate lyase [Roseomonas sp.]MCA3334325.1 argininosuccinate lyase [Roseomonas sp.]MCA3348286.1 argininosuccinate lyase [Roseomonas sp.]